MPKLTVLIDNETSNPTLSTQHGLSIWLEADSSSILFDTGQDGLFLRNAQALGVPATAATHLVLSHGHYDHTGGVSDLLDSAVRPQAIVGPEAWTERRSSHPIGIPWSEDMLSDLPVIINQDVCQIEPGVTAVNVGSTHDAASRHPHLQRSVNGQWEPDTFPDEQILVVQTTEGLVVVTGCTHCGVDALIECIGRVAGDTPVYALVGGLHLGASSREYVLGVTKGLSRIKHVWVNHCTGLEAFSVLKGVLGQRVEWAGAGFEAELPPMVTA